MDSSVIFLVIIGLWAAYLVPHWLRRREQLSASRSVDRFSAAMRVLARRSEAPTRDRRPISRSYVLMPPRESVREVVVKRARPVDDGMPRQREARLGPRGEAAHHAGARPARPPAAHLDGGSPAPDPRASAEPRAPRRPATAARGRAALVLSGVLLGIVAAVPVLAVLGLVGAGPRWLPVPALGLTLALVAALRARALRTRALRARTARAGAARVGALPVTTLRDSALPAGASRDTALRASMPDSAQPATSEGSHGAGATHWVLLADAVPGPVATLREAAADLVSLDHLAGWTPVPVPPPTYTLKAQAPQRRSAPLPTTGPLTEAAHTAHPKPATSGEAPPAAFDLDAVLERRRASGE